MNSVLIHPLTRQQVRVFVRLVVFRLWIFFSACKVEIFIIEHIIHNMMDRDHEDRVAWLGQSYGLDLSTLPVYSEELPIQYSSLSMPSLRHQPPLKMYQDWDMLHRHSASRIVSK